MAWFQAALFLTVSVSAFFVGSAQVGHDAVRVISRDTMRFHDVTSHKLLFTLLFHFHNTTEAGTTRWRPL